MSRYVLPIDIRALEEGGYLAVCPVLQGCHAQGETITRAIDSVQDVVRVLLELYLEDGKPVPVGVLGVSPKPKLFPSLFRERGIKGVRDTGYY